VKVEWGKQIKNKWKQGGDVIGIPSTGDRYITCLHVRVHMRFMLLISVLLMRVRLNLFYID